LAEDEYFKRVYDEGKAAKAELRRRRAQQVPTKVVHLTVGIADHDLDAKAARARRLLGSRVNLRVTVDRIEPPQEALARAVLERFVAAVGDAADGAVPAQLGDGELVAVLWSS
jgi:translation initiation factor IF-3